MVLLSKRSEVQESATMRLISQASLKQKLGEKIYNFAAGDPVLPNHPAIFEGVLRGYSSKLSPYPPVAGVEALRHRFSEWMNINYQTSYSEEETLITTGGKFALFALAELLLEEGDEALIVSPYWVSYPGIIELSSAKPVFISANKSGKITPSDLEEAITPQTKVFILNNGSNPTGVLYTREELRALLEVAEKNNIFVISDEVYSHLVFSSTPYISCGSFKEFPRVAVVQSFSKNFAMAGWRIGAVFTEMSLIKRLTTIQGQATSGASIISQWAALGALKEAPLVTSYVKEALRKRREAFFNTLQNLFSTLDKLPDSAIYSFLPVSFFKSSLSSEQFCERALSKGNIVLVPGGAFGKEGYVRFSFSEEEERIIEGLHTLKKLIQEGL